MRCLPRLVTGLSAALLLFLPCASHAHSEWPAISSRLTQLSQEERIPMTCRLESHVGHVYFRSDSWEFGRLVRFMVELAHYVNVHTNAGPTYLIMVHFEDHVRSISIRDLEAIHHAGKTGFNDPKVIYDFFSRLEDR